MLRAKKSRVGSGGVGSWPRLSSPLERDLEKVREVAPPPPDDAIYAYLTKVFGLAEKWWKPAAWAEIEAEIEEYFENNFDSRFAHERFRLIIELTAPAHINVKMKWKYAAALRVVLEQKKNASEVAAFIKSHGGLNKIIDWRKIKKRQLKNRGKRPKSK